MRRWFLICLLPMVTACSFSTSRAPVIENIVLLPTVTPAIVAQAVIPTASPVTIPTVTLTPTEDRNMADLPQYGNASELNNTAWLNTSAPLSLADLRGSVVLLEFWTFDCINCIRTLPYVQRWHETYASQGLVVIGNHYPEFDYEHDILNVQAAANRFGITYAIAQDNDAATWRAYNQIYWPTLYLIDKWGMIRYFRIGEGAYDRTEAAIQALLAERYEADAALAAPSPRRYLTPTTTLNVRSGAGTQFAQIGSVNPDMAFVILGEENGWYIINYNGANGYVSGEYVTIAAN